VPVTYDEWEKSVHNRITEGPVWKFLGYRKALFLYELTWQDCDKLGADRKGKAIVNQIIRSAGSISANIEEGQGCGFGKEYGYFLRVAAGSAREIKGWYWRGKHTLSTKVLDHRLKLLDEIIGLLVTEINRQKTHNQRKK